MAHYSGFQSNAFQRNAFQIVGSTPTPNDGLVLLGGGPGYEREQVYNPHAFRYRQEELQRERIEAERKELKRIDDELAEAERHKLEALAKESAKLQQKNAAKKLAALEATLQEEINRLRIERAWLMRRLDDEECILILMIKKRKRIF